MCFSLHILQLFINSSITISCVLYFIIESILREKIIFYLFILSLFILSFAHKKVGLTFFNLPYLLTHILQRHGPRCVSWLSELLQRPPIFITKPKLQLTQFNIRITCTILVIERNIVTVLHSAALAFPILYTTQFQFVLNGCRCLSYNTHA